MREDEIAERALANLRSLGSSAPWPPVAERIRAARTRAGLTEEQVAERSGLASASEYWDLELYDEEAFTCVSVAEIHRIAAVLDTTASRLLFGEELPHSAGGHDCATIAHLLADRIASENITAEEMGERLGWDLHQALEEPDALMQLNIVGWRDVCTGVGVGWIEAFLAAAKGRPTKSSPSGVALEDTD